MLPCSDGRPIYSPHCKQSHNPYMQTKEHIQLYADQGAYAAVCRPRSLCSCIQTEEPIPLYTDQGAYAAVYRPRSLYRCMQTKEHIQLYADQGAYAAVCRPRSICSCMQTKEHMQLYAGQGAYAAVCRARSLCSCRSPYLSTNKIGQIRSQNSNNTRLRALPDVYDRRRHA